tara:strand:- start:3 stop:1547 length:1545 start_codon:yes stop_codon:yes gene_type:complete
MRQIKQRNGMKRSSTGFYSFRKQVPESLRSLWGKREVKVGLETKDEATALKRCSLVLADFNSTKSKLTQLLEGANDLAPQDMRNIADGKVRNWGIHPDQAPVLQAGHTETEYAEFKEAERAYLERKDLYYDLAADELIDEEQRHKDYRSGKWGQPDYQTPYKAQSKTTVAGVTEGIVAGRVATTVNPTLMDAMNSYLEEYAEKNIGGNARTIQSQTTNTKRVLAQFASFIEGGRTAKGFQREVTSITVEEAIGFRRYLREQHPNSGTGDTNLRYPSAVFSHIIEKGQGLYIDNHLMRNPFYKLRNKKREEQLANKKWPFNPEEFRKYEEAAYEAEDHVKLLILFLLYTGCRVSDAYGLEVRDVNLTENIPTMYLRHNGIRRLDKDGIQSNIPLVGPLLEALRSYEMSDSPNDPIFPEFANIRSGRDRASAQANKVRKKAGVTRDGVTAHSARHTWQDRLDAARVPIAERDYLISHKTKQSSAVAQAYGSAYPAKNMLENQLAALACTDWGDFRT